MRRPSVLFLNRVYPPGRGATGRVLRDLARSFAREGWNVTVITTGLKALKERDGGVRVIRLKSAGKPGSAFGYAIVWLKILFVALRLSKTDLVVSMSDPPFLVSAGQIVKRIKGARHIHWCQDLYPDVFPAINVIFPAFVMKAMKSLTRANMKRADKVVVIGRCMAERLTVDGITPGHITIIPNWPDFELAPLPDDIGQFNGHGVEPQTSRGVRGDFRPFDQQHKQGQKFRVLYAGNLGKAHPIKTIVQAASMLAEEHPEIEFVFVGDGPRFERLARERAKRHLDNIRLMPYQPLGKLRAVMESGDVHVVSMKHEAAGAIVPCKLYSALAAQRPCIFIGPSQSESAMVVKDFKAGAIVAQGDAASLASEIKRYCLSADDWFAAHNGAREAAQVFVPKDAIKAWVDRAWAVVEPGMDGAGKPPKQEQEQGRAQEAA